MEVSLLVLQWLGSWVHASWSHMWVYLSHCISLYVWLTGYRCSAPCTRWIAAVLHFACRSRAPCLDTPKQTCTTGGRYRAMSTLPCTPFTPRDSQGPMEGPWPHSSHPPSGQSYCPFYRNHMQLPAMSATVQNGCSNLPPCMHRSPDQAWMMEATWQKLAVWLTVSAGWTMHVGTLIVVASTICIPMLLSDLPLTLHWQVYQCILLW
jgi:hypothetical protein